MKNPVVLTGDVSADLLKANFDFFNLRVIRMRNQR
jgi:hypothetical protein